MCIFLLCCLFGHKLNKSFSTLCSYSSKFCLPCCESSYSRYISNLFSSPYVVSANWVMGFICTCMCMCHITFVWLSRDYHVVCVVQDMCLVWWCLYSSQHSLTPRLFTCRAHEELNLTEMGDWQLKVASRVSGHAHLIDDDEGICMCVCIYVLFLCF